MNHDSDGPGNFGIFSPGSVRFLLLVTGSTNNLRSITEGQRERGGNTFVLLDSLIVSSSCASYMQSCGHARSATAQVDVPFAAR